LFSAADVQLILDIVCLEQKIKKGRYHLSIEVYRGG